MLKVPEKEEKTLRGYWDDDTRQLPIAVREARALLHTLESVGEIIANSRVDCFIDNKVVVSCWERQLSQMPALSSVMKDIFSLTLKFNLALKTFLVPSRENPADFPSRSLSDADCKLSPLAWKLVDQAFGPHSLDLMACPPMFSVILRVNLSVFSPRFLIRAHLVQIFSPKCLIPPKTHMFFPPLFW